MEVNESTLREISFRLAEAVELIDNVLKTPQPVLFVQEYKHVEYKVEVPISSNEEAFRILHDAVTAPSPFVLPPTAPDGIQLYSPDWCRYYAAGGGFKEFRFRECSICHAPLRIQWGEDFDGAPTVPYMNTNCACSITQALHQPSSWLRVSEFIFMQPEEGREEYVRSHFWKPAPAQAQESGETPT